MTSPGHEEVGRRTGAIVVALFPSPSEASDAIADLREAGFSEDAIGIAMQDREAERDLAEGTGAAEGAARGALSGGMVGGALGLLGSLLIPGVGPIIAGGILATTLAGASIGAATGGIIGALVAMGTSPEDAEHFDRGFREGAVLVTVRADDRALEARAILRDRQGDLGPSYRPDNLGNAEAGVVDGTGDDWRGHERRARRDFAYAGPERRGSPF